MDGSWNQRQNVRIELEGFEDTVDFGILDVERSAIDLRWVKTVWRPFCIPRLLYRGRQGLQAHLSLPSSLHCWRQPFWSWIVTADQVVQGLAGEVEVDMDVVGPDN